MQPPSKTISTQKFTDYKPLILLSGSFSYHLDHLAPLSYFYNLPLFVDDHECYAAGKSHYPEANIHLKAIDLKEIGKNYNLIILSGRQTRIELDALFRSVGVHGMRFCFCPHGHSDKSLEIYEGFDLALIYGEKQKRLFGERSGLSTVGNYRAAFYEERRRGRRPSLFAKEQKTILYAPTWADYQTFTSFFDSWQELLDLLPPHYNLIIKLHPLLEKHHPSHAWKALAHDKIKPNVRVVLELPEIYPLLEGVDLYLGDYSSIGYDFLYFNRPMFFLARSPCDLHKCGKTVSSIQEFFTVMEDPQQELRPLRKEFYEDAFSPFML